MSHGQILAFSPYDQKLLYPAFSRLLIEASKQGFDVKLACPGIGISSNEVNVEHYRTWRVHRSKLHHITFLLSAMRLLLTVYLARQHVTVIILGPLSSLLFFVVLPIRRKVQFVSYQPELHEDRLGFFLPVFRWISRNVDLFLDVDPLRLLVRDSLFKIRPKNRLVLPNYIHLDGILSQNIRTKSQDNGQVKFVYGGALSDEHGIDQFLNIFASIRTQWMEFHIYPITYPGHENRVGKLKSIFGSDVGVYWHNSVDHSTFLDHLDVYDIGLCSYPWISKSSDGRVKENLNSKYAAPSKVHSYLSRGLLVLTGRHPTLSHLIEKEMILPFDYGDSKSLASVIREASLLVDFHHRRNRALKYIEIVNGLDLKSLVSSICCYQTV